MPLFGGKKQKSLLPADIARRMVIYGKFEFAPQQSGPDAARHLNELIYGPLYPIASANPDGFITASAAAVLPSGAWAVYGGQRCVRDLVTARTSHPDYVAMVDAAMQFLRSQGYGLMYVAPVDLEVWRELHPDEAW